MRQREVPTVEEVALGALLHDIGKLVQRARVGAMPDSLRARQSDVLPSRDGRPSHWHALWSDWFFDQCETGDLKWPGGVDRAWVRNLAVFHHRPLQDYRVRPQLALSALVTLADRMASGFERKARDAEAEAAWQDSGKAPERFRRTPIEAIVSHVRLSGADNPERRAHHAPRELSPEAIMPEPQPDGEKVAEGYAALWESFKNAWNDAVARCQGDPAAFEEAVLSLSERFLWAVPSSTMDQPDVSLHDHGRAVAAFACAAWRWHEANGTLADADALADAEACAFRFVVGDLSGLQATLFRLNSENAEGVNKILRGRSTRFQLIADAALRQTLAAFGMPMSGALQTAGGRFLAVVPALDDARRRIDELRAEFDRWFAAEYGGELALGLALSDAFSAADLTASPGEADDASARVRRVRASLVVASESAKLGLLAEQAAAGVLALSFPEGACKACGVRPARGEGRCDACDAEHRLGERLPHARAIVVRAGKAAPGQAVAALDQHDLVGLGEGREAHDRERGWRWMLRPESHGPAPMRAGPPWVARFGEDLAAYADLDEKEKDQIKTFAALARDAREEGRGRELLALIKGDVDRLGEIFSGGLGPRWSVARSAALSRMMDAYFSLRLPWLLEKHYPDSYTIYAGGDDFMLVMPWRQAFDFAIDLRKDFSDFAAGNPGLTFSLGIALFGARTPVSIAAREAEDRLERAKSAGRNRVCAIEREPMTWDQFSRAMDHARQLHGWLSEGKVSSSLLYRLLTINEARTRIARKRERPDDYAWMARFGYQLARNVKDGAIRDSLREMFGLDSSWRGTGDVAPGVRLAFTHAIYRNR